MKNGANGELRPTRGKRKEISGVNKSVREALGSGGSCWNLFPASSQHAAHSSVPLTDGCVQERQMEQRWPCAGEA